MLSLLVILTDKERRSMNMNRLERVYGYTRASGMTQALATGYFLWDLCRTAPNIEVFGVETVAHAASALTIYLLGFRPFINFYSCNFLLWQLSTPFVNIHWFLDKLDMTGSRAQLINGILLVIIFFCCRLIYGTSQAAAALYDVWAIKREEMTYVPGPRSPVGLAGFPGCHKSKLQFDTGSSRIPFWLCLTHLTCGATLTFLNFYWFFKIILSLRKRFDSKNEKPEVASGVTKTSDKASTTDMAQPKKPGPNAD
ncbi:hypothetical protein QQS21_010598 [Conoideocrella luteorostrata]|uniref:TLC domain-containing protein n=1 Tax=Conoideocrella luteorostrata TaxID=1105319 RepID=A0AAJ0CEQ4_9HYPO|nr:hypothetical protein QQS21_010598 [Conoideocrella luteorostrata]